MNQDNIFWLLFSFILTIMVFSYIFGDNPLFRLATYFFVGVSSAYVLVLIFYQVIIPKLITPFISGNIYQMLIQLIPLTLSILLVLKLFKSTSHYGDYSLAFLVGSGAAIILIGAFAGTLMPMIDMITDPFSVKSFEFNRFTGGIILIIGAVSSLLYFQFSKSIDENVNPNLNKVYSILKSIGSIFIGIALGSIFAGVIISAVIALIERFNFIVTFIYNLFFG